MWLKAQSELAGDCKSHTEQKWCDLRNDCYGVTKLETIDEKCDSKRRLDYDICLVRIVDGSVNEKDSSTCSIPVIYKFFYNRVCGSFYRLAPCNTTSGTYRTFVDCGIDS